MLRISRKNEVGASSGKVIVQNRRVWLRQSIAAASLTDWGMDCSPERKKTKL